MTERRDIPIAPLALGLAGLIPFWALGLIMSFHMNVFLSPPQVSMALATYGAIIISFLGGIRWGLALSREDSGAHYAISVLPSLVAWVLVMAPDPWRLAGLGLGALVLGPVDMTLVRAGLAPRWFGRLRLLLSTGAGLALLLAARSVG